MRLANNPTAKNDRRISALKRLDDKKNPSAKDYAEIDTLKARIVPTQVARASRSKVYRGPK